MCTITSITYVIHIYVITIYVQCASVYVAAAPSVRITRRDCPHTRRHRTKTHLRYTYLRAACADWPTGARPFGAGGRPCVARIPDDGRTDKTHIHSPPRPADPVAAAAAFASVMRCCTERVTRRLRRYNNIIIIIYLQYQALYTYQYIR